MTKNLSIAARRSSKTYIKLAKHVARRQRHFPQIGRVPGRHDNASIFGIVFDLVNALRKLINPLARVIRVHINVFRSEMTPLETVDWTQITYFAVFQATRIEKLARSVSVPNMNIFRGQVVRVRVTLYKPEQFLGNTAPKRALGSQQRQCVVAKRETHLRAKFGQSARTGAIPTLYTRLKDFPAQVQVLHLLCVDRLP